MNRKTLGTLAGASALGIGIGLQRSQFGVLGELMAKQHWFADSMIGELGGISLAGYITGCIFQRGLKSELNNIRAVRVGLALAVLSFFIEPLISADSWQILWRFIAGWASAQLVTGVPGLGVRYHSIDEKRRALAYVFAGAGFAALLGSVLVSLIASASIINSWVVTGMIAVVMAIPIHLLLDFCIEEELAKRNAAQPQAVSDHAGAQASELRPSSNMNGWGKGLKLLALSTFFFGASQVTVLTYYPLLLVDKFNVTQAAAQASFANVGIGYTIGALATGYMNRKWKTDSLMTISALIGAVGTTICAIAANVPLVGIGAFAFAFWNGSMMGLLLHRINQSVAEQYARTTWSQFSLILSLGFLGFSFISAAIADTNVNGIIWSGSILAIAHLAFQILAKRRFEREYSN